VSVAINKDDLQFKNIREMAIYEIAHTMGMMKREQEIQQEVSNSIMLEDMKYNTIIGRSDDRFRLHSDKWFDGMITQINKIIELIKEKD
jgi:hypothetical protein